MCVNNYVNVTPRGLYAPTIPTTKHNYLEFINVALSNVYFFYTKGHFVFIIDFFLYNGIFFSWSCLCLDITLTPKGIYSANILESVILLNCLWCGCKVCLRLLQSWWHRPSRRYSDNSCSNCQTRTNRAGSCRIDGVFVGSCVVTVRPAHVPSVACQHCFHSTRQQQSNCYRQLSGRVTSHNWTRMVELSHFYFQKQ